MVGASTTGAISTIITMQLSTIAKPSQVAIIFLPMNESYCHSQINTFRFPFSSPRALWIWGEGIERGVAPNPPIEKFSGQIAAINFCEEGWGDRGHHLHKISKLLCFSIEHNCIPHSRTKLPGWGMRTLRSSGWAEGIWGEVMA